MNNIDNEIYNEIYNEINEDDYRRILKEELKTFKQTILSKEKPVTSNVKKLKKTEESLKIIIRNEVELAVKISLEDLLLTSEEFQKNKIEQKSTKKPNSEIRFLKEESVFTHVIKFSQFLIKSIFNQSERENKYSNNNDPYKNDLEKKIREKEEKRFKQIEEHLRKINLYKRNKNYANRSAYYVMYEIDKETEKEHLFYHMYSVMLEKVKQERVFKILSSFLKILFTFTILLSAIFIFVDIYMGRELRIQEAKQQARRLQKEQVLLQEKNKLLENQIKLSASKREELDRKIEFEELKQKNEKFFEKIQAETDRLEKEVLRFTKEVDKLKKENGKAKLKKEAILKENNHASNSQQNNN